jgi:hypothetical protein
MKTDIEIILEQPFAEGSTAPEHLVEFINLLSPRKYTISKDFKNRELAIFYK